MTNYLFDAKLRIMRQKTVGILFLALCSLLVSCDWEGWESGSGYKSFDYNLQGSWVTNDPDSIYSGALEITFDRITITGYGESQTVVPWGNDAERPFRTFIKGVALKAYSEEGHIYIENAGIVQAGIPYVYWLNDAPYSYERIEFLTFDFGGRQETLRKQ